MIDVYPTSSSHVAVWVVIKEAEGVRTTRVFSGPPPQNILEDGCAVLETCLDFFDEEEKQ